MALGVRSSCSNSQPHLKTEEGYAIFVDATKSRATRRLQRRCNDVDTKNRTGQAKRVLRDANGGRWYVVT